MSRARLMADAVNRAARTIYQAVAVEVGVVLVPYLYRVIGDEEGNYQIGDVTEHGVRIVALAILAFVMRRYLDLSPVPTPLPPADPGRPADPVAGA